MPTTPNGISYSELPDSPQFHGTGQMLTATAHWLIDWADIWDLFDEAFPSSVGGTYFSPMQYPGISHLYATDLKVKPFKGSQAVQEWDAVDQYSSYNTGAEATIVFNTVAWEQQSGSGQDTTIRTVEVAIGGEFLRLPQWKMHWDSASGDEVESEDIDLGKFIPTIEYSVTHHFARALPLSTIVGKVGCVNETNDVLSHINDETLLYLGANGTRNVTWKGTGTWRITHRFSERRVKHGSNTYGWNHFWDPETQAWRLVVDENGDKIFPATEFATLFTATS